MFRREVFGAEVSAALLGARAAAECSDAVEGNSEPKESAEAGGAADGEEEGGMPYGVDAGLVAAGVVEVGKEEGPPSAARRARRSSSEAPVVEAAAGMP